MRYLGRFSSTLGLAFTIVFLHFGFATEVIIRPELQIAVPSYVQEEIRLKSHKNSRLRDQFLEDLILSQAEIRCKREACGPIPCQGVIQASIRTVEKSSLGGHYLSFDGTEVPLDSSAAKKQSIFLSEYHCTDNPETPAAFTEGTLQACQINSAVASLNQPKECASVGTPIQKLKQLDQKDKDFRAIVQSGFCYTTEVAMKVCLAYLNFDPRETFAKELTIPQTQQRRMNLIAGHLTQTRPNVIPASKNSSMPASIVEQIKADYYPSLNERNCRLPTDSYEKEKELNQILHRWLHLSQERLMKLSRSSNGSLSAINLFVRAQSIATHIAHQSLQNDRVIAICDSDATIRAMGYVKIYDDSGQKCLELQLLTISPQNLDENGNKIPEYLGAGREALFAAVKRAILDPEVNGCITGSPLESSKSFYFQFGEVRSRKGPEQKDLLKEFDAFYNKIKALRKASNQLNGDQLTQSSAPERSASYSGILV